MTNFLETSPSLTNEEIVQVESEMSVKFPADFISHYLRYNGGYPEFDTYRSPDGTTTRINSFFPMKYDDLGRIEIVYRNLVTDEDYLPIGIIPFGIDDGGNFFCISTRKKDYGNVYYINNDDYDPADVELSFTFLESNFMQFLDKLTHPGPPTGAMQR